MRLQLLSDLHLETESFDPQPAPGAELLVLAGDIDSRWTGLERFAGWPVPVLFVAGNHEFDGRELDDAWPALRDLCEKHGLTLLERESLTLTDRAGRRLRFVATIRWADLRLLGRPAEAKAIRAASYFMRLMAATRQGAPFDAVAMQDEADHCRRWLQQALAESREDCDAVVAVTHFGPSLRSADPRFGAQAATASFCNADDDLLPLADVWIHGHLHCRHDYVVPHGQGTTRVVSNARGHTRRGETVGHDPLRLIEV